MWLSTNESKGDKLADEVFYWASIFETNILLTYIPDV